MELEINRKKEWTGLIVGYIGAMAGLLGMAAYNYYMSDDKWKNRLVYSMKALNYTNIPEKINKENVDALYGSTLKTSISKLEKYRT